MVILNAGSSAFVHNLFQIGVSYIKCCFPLGQTWHMVIESVTKLQSTYDNAAGFAKQEMRKDCLLLPAST